MTSFWSCFFCCFFWSLGHRVTAPQKFSPWEKDSSGVGSQKAQTVNATNTPKLKLVGGFNMF